MQIPKLREWREARALTQVELADKAGVSPRSVASYEAGGGARPPTVRRLAGALRVEVTDLIGETTSPKAESRSSLEPSFNDVLAEERRGDWEDAVAEAQRLRESGWAQMWKALSGWRASKKRGESYAARRKCLDEMGSLLQEVYDADRTVGEAYIEAALTQGGSEAPWPRYLQTESRKMGHFYGALLGLVTSIGLSVRTGASEADSKDVPLEERPRGVEEPAA